MKISLSPHFLTTINTNKATVPGDFPARLSKQFAAYPAEPLSDIFNKSMKREDIHAFTNLRFVHLCQNRILLRKLLNSETLVDYSILTERMKS